MNLIQKIIKKVEKKIDEIFLTRKINNYIERLLINAEEGIINNEKRIAECIIDNDIDLAYGYYCSILGKKIEIERVKSFKDYLLKNQKE